MTDYAFIPARGGSERIPSKNMATVGGRTLIQRAIDCAHEAGLIPVVSSEDPKIGRHAIDSGAVEWHPRPATMATATCQIETAIKHWLYNLPTRQLGRVRTVSLLQPTTPLRRPETVRECVRLVKSGFDNALTVSLDSRRNGRLRSHECGTLRAIWNQPANVRLRSQDARKQAVEDGNVWTFSVEHFRHTKNRMGGPKEAVVVVPWWESVEIDEPHDLELAEALLPVVERWRSADG